MRKKLVKTLREKGIRDERILEAIGKVPRHLLLDRAFEEWAYRDTAFPIACDQTISQPYTVAYQTTLLNISSGDKVLEIGTGSGYQAIILAEMGAKVYTIERQEDLYHATNHKLRELGYGNIRTFLGDGTQGIPRFQPYEGILVTAASEDIPPPLREQLAIGGHLVIPVGSNDSQVMVRLKRINEDEYVKEKFDYFRFVPLLKGINRRQPE